MLPKVHKVPLIARKIPTYPILSHPLKSHRIPSHLVSSYLIRSHHIPYRSIPSHPNLSYPIPSHPFRTVSTYHQRFIHSWNSNGQTSGIAVRTIGLLGLTGDGQQSYWMGIAQGAKPLNAYPRNERNPGLRREISISSCDPLHGTNHCGGYTCHWTNQNSFCEKEFVLVWVLMSTAQQSYGYLCLLAINFMGTCVYSSVVVWVWGIG